MADDAQLKLLKQGAKVWNEWRQANPEIAPNLVGTYLRGAYLRGTYLREADLSGADLGGADLRDADLSEADLSGADLSGAYLRQADLSKADLRRAHLSRAYLREADLSGADIRGADIRGADLSEADLVGAHLVGAHLVGAHLSGADLSGADIRDADLSEADLYGADLRGAYLVGAHLVGAHLSGADLSRATLTGANLVGAHLSGADLSRATLSGANLSEADLQHCRMIETDFGHATLYACRIYGISAWNLKLDENTLQSNLIITPGAQPTIEVDNLEVAQFIYLLLNNQKIRDVIETITSKVVLILGNFAPERKAVLDAIREELRKRGYCPVLFDFKRPKSRDLEETVRTLAHMARFIFADITDPRSIPHELRAIVPNLSVPVQPLILASQNHYAMLEGLYKYRWFLQIFRYDDLKNITICLDKLIDGAEGKVRELAALRINREG